MSDDTPTYPCDNCKIPVELDGNNLMKIGGRKLCVSCGTSETGEDMVISLIEHEANDSVEIVISRSPEGKHQWHLYVELFGEGVSDTKQSAENDARERLSQLVHKLAVQLGYIHDNE